MKILRTESKLLPNNSEYSKRIGTFSRAEENYEASGLN